MCCVKFEKMEAALIICVLPPPHTLSVHRDRLLLHPALSVQEEEREAHRRRDAAGGSARYEQREAVRLGTGAVD